MKNKFIWWGGLSTADETRKVSSYMKNVVEKRDEKKRKKRLKQAKNWIDSEIARTALEGRYNHKVVGISEDIAPDLVQWLNDAGYTAIYISSIYPVLSISWEDNNADQRND